MQKVKVKPKKARKTPTNTSKDPKETSQVVALSIAVLNLDLVLEPVVPSVSQERYADSGTLPTNPISPGASLHPPPPPPSAPQLHVTVFSEEGDSRPVGGGVPRGVPRATLGLQLLPRAFP